MDIWAIINIVLITINVLVLVGIIIVFTSLYNEFKIISRHYTIIECNTSSIKSQLGYIERMSESAMRRLVAVESKVGIHGAV